MTYYTNVIFCYKLVDTETAEIYFLDSETVEENKPIEVDLSATEEFSWPSYYPDLFRNIESPVPFLLRRVKENEDSLKKGFRSINITKRKLSLTSEEREMLFKA